MYLSLISYPITLNIILKNAAIFYERFAVVFKTKFLFPPWSSYSKRLDDERGFMSKPLAKTSGLFLINTIVVRQA
ncbi:hypothetical protein SOASR031_02770 [Leminorella grimontii]|nr:hypothetical protein SOASR031_02770 [Leminorella grimontii]